MSTQLPYGIICILADVGELLGAAACICTDATIGAMRAQHTRVFFFRTVNDVLLYAQYTNVSPIPINNDIDILACTATVCIGIHVDLLCDIGCTF